LQLQVARKRGDGGNTNKEVILVRTLLNITVLVSFLSVTSPSFGLDHMSLYTQTPASINIASEVSGDHVEEDFMSFYLNPLQPQLCEESVEAIIIAERAEPESEGDYINVLGVKIPSKSTRGAI
jgi:hypothetical protein